MFILYVYFIISLLVGVTLLVAKAICDKTTVDKEKRSPFECGFDPVGLNRVPFCMKFFIVGVIFLLFDVEVCLLIPLPFATTSIISFILILLIGLSYEWVFGGLEWLA